MAFTEQGRLKAALRTAVKLLREAKSSIDADLVSAGADEVRQHPSLRARDRLSNKIGKFLGRQATE